MREHNTSFSVLTKIELNLPVEFTKSCQRWAPFSELENHARYG
jgi:hypothetical protein